jgi:photosystem II stability/assembly factor-like uncharacterized protein
MADPPAQSRSASVRPRGRPAHHTGSRTIPRAALLVGFMLVVLAVITGVYLSRASRGGGTTFGILQTGDFHALTFSTDNPNVVFFGHHNGVMRSADGGRTWSTLVEQPNFDAMGLGLGRAGRMYLAGHDVFQSSDDGGVSWQPISHNLPGTDIHGFAVSPDAPNQLYAFVAGQGGFRSADAGQTWQPLDGELPEDVMALAAGGAGQTLFANSMGSGLLRSADAGRTWMPTMAGMDTGTSGMSGMPGMGAMSGMGLTAVGTTVYAGTHGGLYKSMDSGTTWTKLPFPADNVAVIAASPTQPDIVLAIIENGPQGLVYRSEDGGQTWKRPE